MLTIASLSGTDRLFVLLAGSLLAAAWGFLLVRGIAICATDDKSRLASSRWNVACMVCLGAYGVLYFGYLLLAVRTPFVLSMVSYGGSSAVLSLAALAFLLRERAAGRRSAARSHAPEVGSVCKR